LPRFGVLGRFLPGTSVRDVVLRVAADQFVFTPVFLTVVFGSLLGMEGKAAQLPDKLRKDYTATLTSCWCGCLFLVVSFFAH
jgi:hypothetical protein